MKIKSLEIENILSIEKAKIEFGDTGLILVEGFDYDTNRANGAGKSSIFNALSFALFDKIPRKITKSEILRTGTKTGSCSVTVEIGGHLYRVERSRPSNVVYKIDGSVVTMTQEGFESKIGMNYDQFLVTMYTAQDSSNKFIDLNDSGKKNFIMKIMNLEFSKYKDETSKRISAIETRTELLNSNIENYKNTISIYNSSIPDPDLLNKEISNLSSEIAEHNTKINELSKVTEPDLYKYSDLEAKATNKLYDIRSAKREAGYKREKLAEIDRKKPDTSCPYCHEDLSIIDGKAIMASDSSSIDNHRNQIVSEINELDKQISQEQSVVDILNKLADKKREEYRDFREASEVISSHRNAIAVKSSKVESLKEKLANASSIKDKIKSIIDSAKAAKDELLKLHGELVLLQSVESIFDSTGAPAYIMDSIVDSFNEAVTEYINEIWPNASYSIQTYKENKDKSIKAKFSETLTINGKQRSIGSLSGGEIRALSLALDFSIIEVLGSQYGLSLNPVILDEPFNGLDSAGREMVIEILSKFSENRQVWVVDHASESKAMFNEVIRVEKRNGVSQIV